jgi:hypothetical protein
MVSAIGKMLMRKVNENIIGWKFEDEEERHVPGPREIHV